MDAVRRQYERFPYPPVNALALPHRGQGARLAYELGLELARDAGGAVDARTHDGIRILVAGGGTLEPLIVAQAHPRAAEVVTVDFSAASTRRLRRRHALARLTDALYLRRLRGAALAPVRIVHADLHTWQDGQFDYILASNVLQHVTDPAALLARLAGFLAPGGLLRVVTYPQASRFWLRETGEWLRLHDLGPDSPDLVARASAVVSQLPAGHPVRSCFASHREARTATGIVDAFLHACENPLAPLAWRAAAQVAGLTLLGETQHEDARSSFLERLAPATRALDRWTKLQILDDLLELTASPVLWFTPARDAAPAPIASLEAQAAPAADDNTLARGRSPQEVARVARRWRLPSATGFRLGVQLRRAAQLLAPSGIAIAELVAALRREVGAHVAAEGAPLPGLSITEYDTAALLAAPEPWGDPEWSTLESLTQGRVTLLHEGAPLEGATLAQQARRLQCRAGPRRPFIEVEITKGPRES